jgi:hypothetical protein
MRAFLKSLLLFSAIFAAAYVVPIAEGEDPN